MCGNLSFDDFILDSCKSTPGFEFYPKKNIKIDLSELTKVFSIEDYYLEKDNSPFFLVIKDKDAEITIFRSLKVLISNITLEDKAKSIFKKLIVTLNKVKSE